MTADLTALLAADAWRGSLADLVAHVRESTGSPVTSVHVRQRPGGPAHAVVQTFAGGEVERQIVGVDNLDDLVAQAAWQLGAASVERVWISDPGEMSYVFQPVRYGRPRPWNPTIDGRGGRSGRAPEGFPGRAEEQAVTLRFGPRAAPITPVQIPGIDLISLIEENTTTEEYISIRASWARNKLLLQADTQKYHLFSSQYVPPSECGWTFQVPATLSESKQAVLQTAWRMGSSYLSTTHNGRWTWRWDALSLCGTGTGRTGLASDCTRPYAVPQSLVEEVLTARPDKAKPPTVRIDLLQFEPRNPFASTARVRAARASTTPSPSTSWSALARDWTT